MSENNSKSLSAKIETECIVSEEATAVAAAPRLIDKVEKTRSKSKSYVVDLRIHSPASLGYLGIDGIDTAPALVRLAKVKGLDMIAVTDFYSGSYIDRILTAARESSLKVIPGVVIRAQLGSCDDVVLSCLFPENFSTQRIEEFLTALRIPKAMFGTRQHVVKLQFADIISTLEAFGGIALPSRMDKTPHRMSVIPVLVEQFGFRTFDLAFSDTAEFFKRRWPKIKFNLFSFSNANALAQVGSRIAKVKMTEPGFPALREILSRSAAMGQ